MVCDLCQHSAEVELRIKAIELGRADEAVEGGGAVAAGVRTCEQIVLPSQSDSAQRTFCRAVIDLQTTVVSVARQGAPSPA
jgi:hypothetical protein